MKTQLTIEWPYGYCEQFTGTVEEAEAKILASSDGGKTQREESQYGPKFSEWRLGPDGYEWMHLGAIVK